MVSAPWLSEEMSVRAVGGLAVVEGSVKGMVAIKGATW